MGGGRDVEPLQVPDLDRLVFRFGDPREAQKPEDGEDGDERAGVIDLHVTHA
jgi:hypothetical protein